MLQLRAGTVLDCDLSDPAGRGDAGEQSLLVELDGADGDRRRPAIADVSLVGRAEVGDRVVVNIQALELGLGSGGFDIVHVNLTRGLAAPAPEPATTMKLNYTSLQHAVETVEDDGLLELPLSGTAAVLALHGQLAPLAWAVHEADPDLRLGYVQTAGGALPGTRSAVVRELRRRGLLVGHLTAGPCFGGDGEALTTAGAIHHGLGTLGWDAAVCGPGPGIVGSGTPLGHGGLAALDSAHVALALGCPTLLVARMSGADRRERHRGLSHHTLTVLELVLAPLTVALPAGVRSPVGADLRASLAPVLAANGTSGAEGRLPGALDGPGASDTAAGARRAGGGPQKGIARPARIARHDWRRAPVDLPGYAASGLPARTMGRSLAADPMFFAAALAAGGVLAELTR